MKALTEDKAEKLLARYAPVAKSVLTRNVEGALAAAKTLKFPLVLKIISEQALHKTEVSGVRIVNNADELRREYADMTATAKKLRLKVDGVLAQEFMKGHEVIIGIKKDPTFGHVIIFGIGGKYVEIIKDIAFRSCPITLDDAESMINELRYKKILFGARGAKPINMAVMKKTLVSISKLPATHKNIEELDINPFIINDKSGKIVDARIGLKD
jgi:glutathione synthase/RimK-type ligase-like ATP-grasp enzyme